MANETVIHERASSMEWVRGARWGARAATSAALSLALVVMAVGCTGKKRPFGEGVPGVDGMEESVNSEGDVAGAMPVTPGMGGVDEEAVGLAPLDQEGPPGDAVSGRESETCGGDSGACVSTDDLGNGSACVPTGPRDCTSDLDNDCDGQPDNVLDDVCVCVPESVEPCEEHPGLDGRGQCRAGTRTCILGEGNLSSDWGECEGSVGPGEQDSCSVAGDDTDCDGINNGGCPCIEGETRPCGPNTEDGICQRGTQTCVNATFGQCVGAVFPASRNCASNQDNDCDARADNTVDNVCTCAIGSVQACGAHPGRDGNGPCQAGSQTCAGRTNNSTSGFGACSGSVGPAAQDTCAPGNDSNCNGIANEGCACINGNTRACGPDTDVGACQRGSQTCANGAFGQCQGAVFPAPRNCGSQQDNDCDGRPDNTLDNVCECRPGQGNAPCSADANNSRCNGQGQCVPCQTDADCSLVSGGRDSCDGGRCVVDLLADGATCQANNDCVSGLCRAWAFDRDGDLFGVETTLRRICGAQPPTDQPPGGAGVWRQVNESVPANQRFDCCDTDREAHPNQTLFFTRERTGCGGYNFNCRNGDEPAPATFCSNVSDADCDGGGVRVEVADCGAPAAGSACALVFLDFTDDGVPFQNSCPRPPQVPPVPCTCEAVTGFQAIQECR